MANQYTREDHSGEVWWDLTLIKYIGNRKYEAQCSCGETTYVRFSDVKKGRTKSCGHRRRESLKERNSNLREIIGTKVNRLSIVKEVGKSERGDMLVECECECGQVVVRIAKEVKRGKIKSCGCGLFIGAKEANTTHGETGFKLHYTWLAMKKRCDPLNGHENYGLRGIEVCQEWSKSYEAFRDWSYMNGFNDNDPTLSIERIDVNGNYEPSNCTWIPMSEQARNKRNTIYAEVNGVKKPLIEWCDELGLSYHSVWKRINKYGYSPEKALTYRTNRVKLNKNSNAG